MFWDEPTAITEARYEESREAEIEEANAEYEWQRRVEQAERQADESDDRDMWSILAGEDDNAAEGRYMAVFGD